MGRPSEEAGLAQEAGSGAAHPWDTARRLREPVAWTLLVLAAIILLIDAWELFGLPGASPIVILGPAPGTTFGLRASSVAPQFVAGGVFILPIVAVILVAFAGGLTDRARQVVQIAISIQAVTLGLGVVAWLGALDGHIRPGFWFVSDATSLAIVATGLVFTAAVRRSRALRSPVAQYQDYPDDDDDFGEQNEDLGDQQARS